MVRKSDDGFEDLNSGVGDEEPQDAGPGVMEHILLTFSHVKGKVAAAHSPGSGRIPSTPSTPSGAETTSQQESKAEDTKDIPHTVEKTVGEDLIEHSPPEQQQEAIHGLDSPGAVGQAGLVGDGVGFTGSARSVEAGTSSGGSAGSFSEGRAANRKVPPGMDLGERIMGKLPGCHANPYTVRSPAATPTTPSVQRSAPSSPGIFGKFERITKLKEKLHLHAKSPSPRVATETPGTPTANRGTPLATGAPGPTIGTATGPTEA